MPIQIDSKDVKFPEELEIELRSELRDGKILKYPERFKTKTKDSNGKVVEEWPKVRSIPYVAFVDLDLDTFKPVSNTTKPGRGKYCRIQFYKTMRHVQNGVSILEPSSRGTLGMVQPHETEEYWFLKYCSPFVENGFNSKSNKIRNYSCIIFDPEKEDNEKLEREDLIFQAFAPIHAPEHLGGLSEPRLREIAAAFGVKDALKGKLASVKLKLKSAIGSDEVHPKASGNPDLKGYKYMVTLVNDPNYDFSLRANITKAVELGIVEYVPSKKGWYFLAETAPGVPKKYEEKIVGCEPNVNTDAYLADFLSRNLEIKARFESKVKEKEGPVNSDTELDYDNLKTLKAQYEAAGEVEKTIDVIEKMLAIKPKNQILKGELKDLKASLES